MVSYSRAVRHNDPPRFQHRTMAPFSIYLAGFDVFRPDALAYGRALRQACAQRGVVGLYPLDNSPPIGKSPAETADWIFRSNLAAIERADAVMANLNPFRGAEPDSGTAFEVGYAVALGKPVWAYLDDDRDLISRTAVAVDPDDATRHIDAQGLTVEDFGLPLNLMLACSATVVQGDALTCLDRIVQAMGLNRA